MELAKSFMKGPTVSNENVLVSPLAFRNRRIGDEEGGGNSEEESTPGERSRLGHSNEGAWIVTYCKQVPVSYQTSSRTPGCGPSSCSHRTGYTAFVRLGLNIVGRRLRYQVRARQGRDSQRREGPAEQQRGVSL